MKKTILLFVLAISTAAAFAQKSPTEAAVNKGLAGPGPDGTTACQSTFTTGSGESYLTFCVTANGNIAKFGSPQSYSQIYAEGYGVCDGTTNSQVSYHDHEYADSGNWASAAVIQPNGVNTFPLKIVRTTSDGIWILTQTFSRNTNEQTIKVVMTLKNNTAVPRLAFLERYADVDADGNSALNYSDVGLNSAWTYFNDNNSDKGHGLTLRALPGNFYKSAGIVAPNDGDACHQTYRKGPYFGDSALDFSWGLNWMAAGSSKTVSFEYRAM